MASKGGNAGDFATDVEIDAAIHRLTDAELLRLQRVGSYRARMLASAGLGYDGGDLLQEAILRTVAGDRRWRKAVSFVTHLLAVMRSLSSHEVERLHGAVMASTPIEDGEQPCTPPHQFDPERIAAADERYAQIRERFDEDTEVALVLDEMKAGMTGVDIQHDLGLSPQQYETIMLRLRRGIDRTEGWAP